MSGTTHSAVTMHDEDPESDALEHLLDDSIGTTSGRTSKFDITEVRRIATMVNGGLVRKELLDELTDIAVRQFLRGAHPL